MATAAFNTTGLNISSNSKKQKTGQLCAESEKQAPMRQASQSDKQPAPPAEPRPSSRPARPQPLEILRSSSLESLGTPDITTPKDQLIRAEICVEEGPPTLRHGAGRPPSRGPSGGEEDAVTAGTAGGSDGPAAGRPPKPKVRLVEPPMPRNPYLAAPSSPSEDGRHCFRPAECCLKPEGYSRFMWDYQQEAELGHGNFSKVYRAVHRLTGVAFAVKTNRSPITTLQARNMWLNEVQALAAVQGHPHIVRLHDAWFEPDPRSATGPTILGLVGQHYPGGGGPCHSSSGCSASSPGGAERAFIKTELCGEHLGGLTKRRLQLSEQGALELLRQMASALKRVHELGMVHLDVKPDNIYTALGKGLLGRAVSPERAGGSGTGVHYKLGDFGLAMLQGGRRAGVSEGDCRYLAPEALRSRGYLVSGLADRLDIFALGASAYELLRGSELPKHGQEYLDLRSGRLSLPGVDARLLTLLRRMMAADPAQRPSADQLLRSPLLGPGGCGIGAGGGSPLRRQSAPQQPALTAAARLPLPMMRRSSLTAAGGFSYPAPPRPPTGPAPFPVGPQLMPVGRRSVSCSR